MTDDTLPPRKPRTIRSAITWLMENPAWSVPAATFLLGCVLGAVVW